MADTKICPFCGSAFARAPRLSAARWAKRKVCSTPSCVSSQSAMTRRGLRQLPDLTCPVCEQQHMRWFDGHPRVTCGAPACVATMKIRTRVARHCAPPREARTMLNDGAPVLIIERLRPAALLSLMQETTLDYRQRLLAEMPPQVRSHAQRMMANMS